MRCPFVPSEWKGSVPGKLLLTGEGTLAPARGGCVWGLPTGRYLDLNLPISHASKIFSLWFWP